MKGERKIFRRVLGLIVLSIFNFQFSISAKELNPEQEQQFTYYWYAAKEALRKEQYDKAYVLFEFCRLLKPNDGQTLAYLGMMYEGLKMPDQAMPLFKQAYEADPNGQWENYLERSLRQAVNDRRWKEAIKIQDEIDKHKDFDASSAYTRSRLYLLMGKPKQALAALDKYLAIDPDHVPLLTLRVELMEKMHVKAKDLYPYYQRILALNPGQLTILNNYAYLLATSGGDLKEAERMSAITISEEPNNPVYLDTYGWILHLQGQDELALFFLTRALNSASEENKAEIEKHLEKVKSEK